MCRNEKNSNTYIKEALTQRIITYCTCNKKGVYVFLFTKKNSYLMGIFLSFLWKLYINLT